MLGCAARDLCCPGTVQSVRRLDDVPTWSIVCFFVDRRVRRQGVTLQLLRAAVDYARSQGARVIEGYPAGAGSTSYTHMGSPGTFLKVGFRDVEGRQGGRRVMRYALSDW
ncbi:MAG TPA: GNAT family N-acetyltransferase [Spirochaetia bacterium]|nr:GNAT family N-acetyltransferase [Spirochaetia bacterium]